MSPPDSPQEYFIHYNKPMRQIYSDSSKKPIYDQVVTEVKKLAGLVVPQWYRGMAHTLHLHFGSTHLETIKTWQGEEQRNTADFTLFLHGEWEAETGAEKISSVDSSSTQIDDFIQSHSLGVCKTVAVDKAKKKLTFRFEEGVTLTAFDREGTWFVLEKFGEYSYSPKANGQVEVTEISLEK